MQNYYGNFFFLIVNIDYHAINGSLDYNISIVKKLAKLYFNLRLDALNTTKDILTCFIIPQTAIRSYGDMAIF